jgi:hypothetical protein
MLVGIAEIGARFDVHAYLTVTQGEALNYSLSSR